jgi:uncharacterized integral membrane protein
MMVDFSSGMPARQIMHEMTEDLSLLLRLSVSHAAARAKQIMDEERRLMQVVVTRAILSLPVLIMATLFAGAAVIEWLAGMFPLPLSTVYGLAALAFALLAVVIFLWPRRLGTR